MSDDIIRAKGYAIYKHILRKALSFLMRALVKSVVTDYQVWDGTVVLNMRVSHGKITRRTAKIIIKDRPPLESIHDDLDADTTVIDRSDLDSFINSGQFDTIIHDLNELNLEDLEKEK